MLRWCCKMQMVAVKILSCCSSSSRPSPSLHCFSGIAGCVAKVFAVAVEDVQSSVQVRYMCLWVGTLHHTPVRGIEPANPLFFSRQITTVKSCTSWLMCAFFVPFSVCWRSTHCSNMAQCHSLLYLFYLL